MLASIQNINSVGPNDNYKQIINFTQIVKGVNKVFGAIGSYLFFPFGLLFGFLLIVQLNKQHSKIRRYIKDIVDDIPNLTAAQLMDLHLSVERLNKSVPDVSMHNNTKYGHYTTIMSKIHAAFKKTADSLEDLEHTLVKAAYPEIQRTFTASELTDLADCYANHDMSDWEDDALDIYEEYYSLNK